MRWRVVGGRGWPPVSRLAVAPGGVCMRVGGWATRGAEEVWVKSALAVLTAVGADRFKL